MQNAEGEGQDVGTGGVTSATEQSQVGEEDTRSTVSHDRSGELSVSQRVMNELLQAG